MISRSLALCAAVFATSAMAGEVEVEEVRAAEAAFYQSLLDADADAMDAIFADDFAYQHGTGATFTKAEFVDLIDSRAATVTRADTPEMLFRDFGDVIITYGNGPVEGMLGDDPYAVDLRFVNVWHRVSDGWVLAHRNSELFPLDEG